jgi:putative nucleotidyltransferase with HDIG domain
VNSSVYAPKNPVSSIGLACSILGLRVLKNLVVQATVMQQFKDVDALQGFDPKELWDHSFKTAVAARMIAARARHVGLDKEDAYTCGLIHDVGKMVLLDSRPQQFAEAVACARQQQLPLAKAEAQMFGFTHAHVGGLLAQRWKLAPDLQAAITYHHSPATEAAQWTKGFLIAAANTMAHRACQKPTAWPGELLTDDSLAVLGLNASDWQSITEDVGSVSAED